MTILAGEFSRLSRFGFCEGPVNHRAFGTFVIVSGATGGGAKGYLPYPVRTSFRAPACSHDQGDPRRTQSEKNCELQGERSRGITPTQS